jgi:hypothetical protein
MKQELGLKDELARIFEETKTQFRARVKAAVEANAKRTEELLAQLREEEKREAQRLQALRDLFEETPDDDKALEKGMLNFVGDLLEKVDEDEEDDDDNDDLPAAASMADSDIAQGPQAFGRARRADDDDIDFTTPDQSKFPQISFTLDSTTTCTLI